MVECVFSYRITILIGYNLIVVIKTVGSLAYNTLFTSTEYLECVTAPVVYRSAAPNLGASTLAGTKHCHCYGVYVRTLLVKNNT